MMMRQRLSAPATTVSELSDWLLPANGGSEHNNIIKHNGTTATTTITTSYYYYYNITGW